MFHPWLKPPSRLRNRPGKPARIHPRDLRPWLARFITLRSTRVDNLGRTYSRLRDLAGLPKDLVLYLARHECGTKICREKGIEYAGRLLGRSILSNFFWFSSFLSRVSFLAQRRRATQRSRRLQVNWAIIGRPGL